MRTKSELKDLLQKGRASTMAVNRLTGIIRQGHSLIIAGNICSGKTTYLNALIELLSIDENNRAWCLCFDDELFITDENKQYHFNKFMPNDGTWNPNDAELSKEEIASAHEKGCSEKPKSFVTGTTGTGKVNPPVTRCIADIDPTRLGSVDCAIWILNNMTAGNQCLVTTPYDKSAADPLETLIEMAEHYSITLSYKERIQRKQAIRDNVLKNEERHIYALYLNGHEATGIYELLPQCSI